MGRATERHNWYVNEVNSIWWLFGLFWSGCRRNGAELIKRLVGRQRWAQSYTKDYGTQIVEMYDNDKSNMDSSIHASCAPFFPSMDK